MPAHQGPPALPTCRCVLRMPNLEPARPVDTYGCTWQTQGRADGAGEREGGWVGGVGDGQRRRWGDAQRRRWSDRQRGGGGGQGQRARIAMRSQPPHGDGKKEMHTHLRVHIGVDADQHACALAGVARRGLRGRQTSGWE